jgi:hypothetical protein
MKAQIVGESEVYVYFCIFDNDEEGESIYISDNELVELTEEQVALVLQYRDVCKKYHDLCKAKKAEQDEKEERS